MELAAKGSLIAFRGSTNIKLTDIIFLHKVTCAAALLALYQVSSLHKLFSFNQISREINLD